MTTELFVLTIAAALVAAVLALLAGTFALPLTVALSRGFVRFTTFGFDQTTCTERLDNLTANLHDEIADLREQDYRPAQIAVVLLVRLIRGIPDELGWRSEHIPIPFARRAFRVMVFGGVLFVISSAVNLADALTQIPASVPQSASVWVMVVQAACTLVYLTGLTVLVRGFVKMRRALYSTDSASG